MTGTASTASTASAKAGTAIVALFRLAGFALLGLNAGIHAYLWDAGYRTIPTIGVLFLLDVIAASVLALAVLLTPRRWLPVVAAGGALLELGTVAGLFVSTRWRLFGFVESSRATLYWQSAITELAGALVLGLLTVLAVMSRRSVRRATSTMWW